MADLDNFFAKKDRKKSKSVKKFSTADELTKKLEDTKQKSDVRPKKERPLQEGDETRRGTEEEEWKEYEDTVKDYTGLKIQVLQGGAGNQGAVSSDGSASEDTMQDGSKVKGPWNKAEPENVVAPPPVEEKPVEPPKPSLYVVPSANRPPPESMRRNQNKRAPDINNDDYFPVLGAAAKPRAGGWSTAGAVGGAPRTASRQPLALGNRFTTLPDDS